MKEEIEKLITDVESTLEKLKEKIADRLEDAYEKGYQEGVSVKPDHKGFHKEHQEPKDYGEDGETVVVSDELEFDDAVKKIVKHLHDVHGFDEEDFSVESVSNQTSHELIAMALPGSEYSYMANVRSDSERGVFGAWVWRM